MHIIFPTHVRNDVLSVSKPKGPEAASAAASEGNQEVTVTRRQPSRQGVVRHRGVSTGQGGSLNPLKKFQGDAVLKVVL